MAVRIVSQFGRITITLKPTDVWCLFKGSRPGVEDVRDSVRRTGSPSQCVCEKSILSKD